jgi:HEPN domain-containing protein
MINALLVLRDVEPPRIHALESLLEMVNETGITVVVPAELLKLEDFAVFARYEADPTPLPASREHLIALLDSSL